MAMLTNLPPEILTVVFHNLGSIDDVHHLGRICKITFRIIQHQDEYLDIVRSIIYQLPQHRFDVQLCQMIELHNLVVDHFRSHSDPIRPTPMDPRGFGYTKPNEIEHLLQQSMAALDPMADRLSVRAALTNGRIYDILARYQGLCVLHELWLRRQLDDNDYLSVSHSLDENTFFTAYRTLHTRDLDFSVHEDVVDPRHRSDGNCTNFNQDQKDRFHAAVTKAWLLNEIRWVLTQFAYPTDDFNFPLSILDIYKDNLATLVATPLLDDLDHFAVYNFLYKHLLPLHLPALADQCSSKLPFTYSSDMERDPNHSTRLLQLCLMAGQTYFQPPDLIDLAVRNRLQQRLPFYPSGLSASAMVYVRPSPAFQLTARQDITTNNDNTLHQPFLNTISSIYGVIQRGTVTQCALHPAQPPSPPAPNGLYPLQDLLDEWLRERCISQFDLHAAPGRQDIKFPFDDHFKRHVRWGVWWWANSEDKARMKMERWRVT